MSCEVICVRETQIIVIGVVYGDHPVKALAQQMIELLVDSRSAESIPSDAPGPEVSGDEDLCHLRSRV